MSNHFDPSGNPRMVDVSAKPVTERTAVAETTITMRSDTLAQIRDRRLAKGDVLAVARLAAIQSAKHTATLIPLCHAIPIEGVEVDCEFIDDQALKITVSVKTSAKTGVEMEALTAASVAALTVYDMCKSADRAMEIGPTRLRTKSGGASGLFEREHTPRPHGG